MDLRGLFLLPGLALFLAVASSVTLLWIFAPWFVALPFTVIVGLPGLACSALLMGAD